MISFRSGRQLRSYLESAKFYPTEKIDESYKCGGKRCEVCVNVNETSNFTSSVTGKTYIKNHRFDRNERCLIYLLTCNKCEMHDFRQTIDQFRSRWNEYKSDSSKHHQGAACMQQHFFNPFCTSGIRGFSEDVSFKLTYPVCIKWKTTGEARLQLWHHLGLILE